MMVMAAAGGGGRSADFDEGCEAFDRGDFERALEEWQPLARHGHPAAQFRLGCLYAFGQEVETDYDRALDLYREAAHQGNADAQNNLGSTLALGWGTEQEPVEGLMWFELAARTGHEMAIRNRNFLSERMSAGEIAGARARAERFLEAQATN